MSLELIPSRLLPFLLIPSCFIHTIRISKEWFDNHYAYDGFTYLDDTVDKIKSEGYTYFIWKLSASTESYEKGVSFAVYWIDGTGMAVQLDGKFHNEPDAPAYNTELCSDGDC